MREILALQDERPGPASRTTPGPARPEPRSAGLPTRVAAAITGLLTGALFGFAVTVAAVVAASRFGRYVYSLAELGHPRWEWLGVAVGGLVFGAVGARSGFRPVGRGLAGAAVLGGLGTAVGAVVGALLGNPWSGGTLGLGLGVVAAWARTVRDTARARSARRRHSVPR